MRNFSYVISYFGKPLENNKFEPVDENIKNVMPLIGLNIYVTDVKKNDQKFSIYIRELLNTKYSKNKEKTSFSSFISDDLCNSLFKKYLLGSDALIIDEAGQPEELVKKIVSAYKSNSPKKIISLNSNKWSDLVANSLEDAIDQVIGEQKLIEK